MCGLIIVICGSCHMVSGVIQGKVTNFLDKVECLVRVKIQTVRKNLLCAVQGNPV
jgi:hypothetical protein